MIPQVPRADGKPDNLGLLVLDEPSVKQSDPTVLSLFLSEETKQHGATEVHTHLYARTHTPVCTHTHTSVHTRTHLYAHTVSIKVRVTPHCFLSCR